MGMSIVNTGANYQIYGDALKTFSELPVKTYRVLFSKFSGFSLESREDLKVEDGKVYGNSPMRAEKILRGFKATDRNFGVILSGRKGVGKSLLMREISSRCLENQLPVIIVDECYPGITNFLSSIQQEVVVLFDEFEKIYSDKKIQEEMLSLFDGIDGGKKLFVITCNDVYKLNEFFLNRPGRFHYHFIVNPPKGAEVEEYLKDNLKEEYWSEIPLIVNLSKTTVLTYDILRAIAFELNMGYPTREAIADLNIESEEVDYYNAVIIFKDGTTLSRSNFNIDEIGEDWNYTLAAQDAMNSNSTKRVTIDFNAQDIHFDSNYELTLDLDAEFFAEYLTPKGERDKWGDVRWEPDKTFTKEDIKSVKFYPITRKNSRTHKYVY